MAFPLMPMLILGGGPEPLSVSVPPTLSTQGTTTFVEAWLTASQIVIKGASSPAAISYLWEKVSGGNITITTPSDPTTRFRGAPVPEGAALKAVFRLRITDAGLGQTVYSNNMEVSLSRR